MQRQEKNPQQHETTEKIIRITQHIHITEKYSFIIDKDVILFYYHITGIRRFTGKQNIFKEGVQHEKHGEHKKHGKQGYDGLGTVQRG